MQNTQTQTHPLKIYRDGQLSRWETYKPVLHAKMVTFGNKINYWFESQGHWPSDAELLQ